MYQEADRSALQSAVSIRQQQQQQQQHRQEKRTASFLCCSSLEIGSQIAAGADSIQPSLSLTGSNQPYGAGRWMRGRSHPYQHHVFKAYSVNT